MADPLFDILLQTVKDEQNILPSKDLHDYIRHIRSLPQSSIAAEREHLATSSQSVKTTLISLTKTSQSQFISGAKAIRDLSISFDEFQDKVMSFVDKLPVDHEESYNNNNHNHQQQRSVGADSSQPGSLTSNESSTLTSSSSPYDVTGTEAVILLRSLDKIQDILELPSLTLACVRNGFYSEALDLASHSRRLGIRYNNIQIIQKIQQETEEIMKIMLLQLIKLFRETVKLPTLIKAISYLRRMQPFQSLPSDSATKQLQHLFLASRLYFIRHQWNTLSPLKQSPDKYLKRYIEVYREHVFASVGGFRTIFPTNDQHQSFETTQKVSSITPPFPESSSTSLPALESESESESSASASQQASTLASSRLIGEFLRATVEDLQQTIREISPLISDKSVRASLWLQLAYCSQSLGRIGGEFWPLVQGSPDPPISNEEWAEAIQKQRVISRDIAQRIGRVV